MYNDFKRRNAFSQRCDWIGTAKMGQQIVVECREVVPGDVMMNDQEIMVRLAPMLAPCYTPVDVYAHHFVVPHRLLWDNWEDFVTGGRYGKNASVRPYLMSGTSGFAVGSTADHLGIPPGVANLKLSALQFRALALIYNKWLRNETLVDELPVGMGDGLDTETPTQLPNRMWRRDYFTSSMPWPQRGDTVYLPLGTEADLMADGVLSFKTANDSQTKVSVASNSTVSFYATNQNVQKDNPLSYDSGLKADLTTATAVTPDQVRTAFQIQLAQVLNARGGYRYPEFIKTHFGVTTSDARMQWPEYIGGGRCPITISEVLQNSSTNETSPQGNMAGHGFALARIPGYKKAIEEYGYIFTIVSIVPQACYSQGIERQWTRETRYDEYLPVYSHLGEQAVRNDELYAQAGDVLDTDGTPINQKTFGFQPRYEEFRRFFSSVHGQFRAGQSLDFWTLQRQFDTLPVLNDQFVTANPSKRIFAVTDQDVDELYILVRNHYRMIRPLPKFGTPGLMDHF